MDLSQSELRKASKSASIVKLQSLLDLALTPDSPELFKEDIKITMATSGLYEWLLKVVSVSGAIGPEGEDLMAQGIDMPLADDKKDDKDKEKKILLGAIRLDSRRPALNSF